MTQFQSSIQAFLDAAASNSPTPGGGSVAALVAALGASMTSMVASLTTGKRFAEDETMMNDLANEMRAAISGFERLMEEDMASFQTYMDAFRMPKESDEQKRERQQALQQATVDATRVPMALAGTCSRLLDKSAQIVDRANKNVISDLAIAAILLEAAAQSALITVDINLGSLKDESLRSELTTERQRLAKTVTEIKNAVVDGVSTRMNG